MYRFFRPILFLFQPETIHHIIVGLLKVLRYVPGVIPVLRKIYTVESPVLEREVFGLKFKNPVGLAAGFDKNAEVYNEISAFGFGFIEIGTVTPLGQPGNKKPRNFRLKEDRALINRMGFNNNGAIQTAKRLQKKHKTVIGGNIGKNTLTSNDNAANDYEKVFEALYDYVDYFVVNVSCPNVSDLRCLQDKDSLSEILTALNSNRRYHDVYKPILLKISPDLNFDQIDDTLAVFKETCLDGIVATNTTISREGLSLSEEEIKAIGNGGLSGAPLTKRTIEVIRYIRKKTENNIPIIAVGGIMTEEDALNMLDAGATLIQIYTGFIYEGPAFAKRINKLIIERNKRNDLKQ